MNAASRKQLEQIISTLRDRQSDLESMGSEEQDKFDGMPESLQQGENGQRIEAAASTIQDAANDLDDAISNLESIE